MRPTLLLLFFLVGAGCDAAFTDLRPEELTATDSGTTADMRRTGTDMGSTSTDSGTVGAGDVGNVAETVIATGSFEPRANYGGEGTATIVKLPDGTFELRIGDDFEVGSVPGPTIVLAREDSLGSEIDPSRGDLEVGVLESNSGAQTYVIPEDPDGRSFVWIYCKPFGLQMAVAPVEAP